ncbi:MULTISPECIES: acyl-CoA-like ligand-binding transcription factor [unclassified Amycolatopsis]|uniref:acyl-CoA-like ligand-binding transcription factor n=1 Tax=unclassified Amycolatopsis TaxID=2618356 RepID=UPI002E15E39F|nr:MULTISPECIES: TetR family transcriptional regulator [unclassified Amycolatopsis]WSK76691.1 TetR family transcriptional regulator [Amycolatopsis sp. NBC_01286]
MDLDTGGLRERKKQETRVALSWAAIRLTVERGLDNVRVEDIAAAAGVSTRTFSNYFGSKGEAIAARQYDRSRAIAAALRERPAGEPLWEAVTHAVLTGFALGEQGQGRAPDQAWIEGVRLMVAEPALQGEMHKAVTAGEAEFALAVAERTGTDAATDVYPQLVAAVVGAAHHVVIQQWLGTDPPPSMEALLRDVFGRLAAGLPEPR